MILSPFGVDRKPQGFTVLIHPEAPGAFSGTGPSIGHPASVFEGPKTWLFEGETQMNRLGAFGHRPPVSGYID